MRFMPLDAKERGYISKHWTWQILRGVQCILLVTKGKVEIYADLPDNTPEHVVRTVCENCRTLRFKRFWFKKE